MAVRTVYEKAAADMRERHGPDHPRRRFWDALADFIAGQGEQLQAAGGRYAMCDDPPSVQTAATLAVAYLESLTGAPGREQAERGLSPREPVPWNPKITGQWDYMRGAWVNLRRTDQRS